MLTDVGKHLDIQINGRPLRVGFAEAEVRDPALIAAIASGGPIPRPGPTGSRGGGGGGGAAGGGGGPTMNNPVQEVTKVLQDMSASQIYEIMVQMKGLIQQNPDQARQILSSNPQVAYALLQSQILLGYVTPAVAQQILVSTAAHPTAMVSGPAPGAMPPAGMMPPNMMPPGPMNPSNIPYGAPPGAASGFGGPGPSPYGMPPAAAAPPPVAPATAAGTLPLCF